MLALTLSTMLLAASPSHAVQDRLPNAAVFFLPKSSLISPVAGDTIDRAAQRVGSGAVVLVQASSDHEAGESTQMAAERAGAVRLALIHDGVPASSIRTAETGVSRPGIESRRVVISIIPPAPSSPRVASVDAVAS
jgi:outer membrane protein OmpA-like peptidoglycan-associated protein